MSGADPPDLSPRTLFTFNSQSDVNQFILGSDIDVGGYSTVHLDLDRTPPHNTKIGKEATARFWGDMSLDVRPELRGKLRTGYAGFRNRVRHECL
jgi:NADH dehydrogenase [ubiquinone] 1 alpha subcomplex assembly factor 1